MASLSDVLAQLKENQAQENVGLTVLTAAVAQLHRGVLSVGDGLQAAIAYTRGQLATALGSLPAAGPVNVPPAPNFGNTPQPKGGDGASLPDLTSAFTAPIESFKKVTSAVEGFAVALSPASALVFNQSLRDLAATIGTALEPVLEVATGVVQEFAASLAPALEKLRPVAEQLAKTFGHIANVFSGAFASVLQSLAPAFRVLADVVSALVPVFQAFYAGVAGLVSALGGLFGQADWQSVTDTLKDAFRSLASYAIQAAAHVAKFADSLLGTSLARDFARGARQALLADEARGEAQRAAPRNAGVTDLASFGRSVTAAALLAGPLGGRTKEDEERAWRESVARNLEAIARGDESDLSKAVKQGFADVKAELAEMIRRIPQYLQEGAHRLIKEAEGRPPRFKPAPWDPKTPTGESFT